MKKLYILTIMITAALASSAQCTFTLTNTSSDTTFIITSNTTLSCNNTPPFRSFLICSGVTVTYQDNSCQHRFYLETGATLIYDTTYSYGYSQVYAKPGSTVDFNNKQVWKKHYESGVTFLDPGMAIQADSVCSGPITFNYSNLPNGTGCASTGVKEVLQEKIELYPNPAGELVNLTVKSFIPGSDYTIYDHTGRVVITGMLERETTVISTASLASGFYLVRINGNENGFIKFVKE